MPLLLVAIENSVHFLHIQMKTAFFLCPYFPSFFQIHSLWISLKESLWSKVLIITFENDAETEA